MPNPTGEQAARELSVKIAQQQAASEQLKAEAAETAAEKELSPGIKTIFGATQAASQLTGAATDLWKTSMQEDLYQAQAAKLRADTKVTKSNAFMDRMDFYRKSLKYYQDELGLEPQDALVRHRQWILGRMNALKLMKANNPDAWGEMDDEAMREMLVMAGGAEGDLTNVLGPYQSTKLSRMIRAGKEYKIEAEMWADKGKARLLEMKDKMGYEIDYAMSTFDRFKYMLDIPELREYALGMIHTHLKAWYETQLAQKKPPISKPITPGTKGPAGQAGPAGQGGQPNAQVLQSMGVLEGFDIKKLFKALEVGQQTAGRRAGIEKIKLQGRSEAFQAVEENKAFVESVYGPLGSQAMRENDATVKAISDPDGINALGLRNQTVVHVNQGIGTNQATLSALRGIEEPKGGYKTYLLNLMGLDEATKFVQKGRNETVTTPGVDATAETVAKIGAVAGYGGSEQSLPHNVKSHTLQGPLSASMDAMIINGKAQGGLANAVHIEQYAFTGDLSQQNDPSGWLFDRLDSDTDIGQAGNDFMEQSFLSKLVQKDVDMNPGNLPGFTQGAMRYNYSTGSALLNGHTKAEQKRLVAVHKAWLKNPHGAARRWSPELIEAANNFINEWEQIASGIHPANVTSKVSRKGLGLARSRMLYRWSYRQLQKADQLGHWDGYYNQLAKFSGSEEQVAAAQPGGAVVRQKSDSLIQRYEVFAALEDLKRERLLLLKESQYYDPQEGVMKQKARVIEPYNREAGWVDQGDVGGAPLPQYTESGKMLNQLDETILQFEDRLEEMGGMNRKSLLGEIGSDGVTKLEALRKKAVQQQGKFTPSREGHTFWQWIFGADHHYRREYGKAAYQRKYGPEAPGTGSTYQYNYPRIGIGTGEYSTAEFPRAGKEQFGTAVQKSPSPFHSATEDYNRTEAIEAIAPAVHHGMQMSSGVGIGLSPKYKDLRGGTEAYEDDKWIYHGVPPYVMKQIIDMSQDGNYKNPAYGKEKEVQVAMEAFKDPKLRPIIAKALGVSMEALDTYPIQPGDPSVKLKQRFGDVKDQTLRKDTIPLEGPERVKPTFGPEAEEIEEGSVPPPKPGEEQGAVRPMHRLNTREEIYGGHLDNETVAMLQDKELNNMGDSALLALHMTLGEFEENPSNRFVQIMLDNQISEWAEFLTQAGSFVPSNALTEYIGEDWSPQAFRERAMGIGHGDIRSKILGDRLNGLRTA